MKTIRWLSGILIFALNASIQSSAQQSNTNLVEGVGVNPGVSDPVAEFKLADAFGSKLKPEAEKGDPIAQYVLAAVNFFGYKVPTDEAEAVKWWRKAADQGNIRAQAILGYCYSFGRGAPQDYSEAVKWYRKAAEQGDPESQRSLGVCYQAGLGMEKDEVAAAKWYRKAAEQNNVAAQCNLGFCYANGVGVPKDDAEAVTWYRKAAEKGFTMAQLKLSACYVNGNGVAQDYVEAYKWGRLALAQGDEFATKWVSALQQKMTPEQIAKAEQLVHALKPRNQDADNWNASSNPVATGTGFFITEDGYLISNYHVVKDAAKVRLLTSAGALNAKLVQVDAANDLALLKTEGRFAPLPVAASRNVQLGNTVATVGFPDPGLQGFSPKLAKGEIAALAGAGDDARYFQISVPVQPGNSGGALVDERGNVVGIVSAKLNAAAALASSGALPENVNYAVKSSFLLSFLESVPNVANKLKAQNTADRKFEDVVKSAQDATVLVLVY